MISEINRRLYLGALAAAVVALILFRLFAVPAVGGDDVEAADVAAAVADSLLGGALAALGVSILVLWLYRRDEDVVHEAIVLEPRTIATEIEIAAESALTWDYRGHTGRYFRSVVLPMLQRRAEHHGRYITARVQLLDPDDDERIQYFIRYRGRANPGASSVWTAEGALSEILATIVAAGAGSVTNPRMTCEVFVGGVVSPFTADLSSTVAILTRESSALGALKYPAGSTFFDSMAEELHLSRDQARRLPTLPPGLAPVATVEDLKLVLNHLDVGAGASDSLLRSTLQNVLKPSNPYPHA